MSVLDSAVLRDLESTESDPKHQQAREQLRSDGIWRWLMAVDEWAMLGSEGASGSRERRQDVSGAKRQAPRPRNRIYKA